MHASTNCRKCLQKPQPVSTIRPSHTIRPGSIRTNVDQAIGPQGRGFQPMASSAAAGISPGTLGKLAKATLHLLGQPLQCIERVVEDESTGQPWSFNVHKQVSVKLPISAAMAAKPGSATAAEFAQLFYSSQGRKIKAEVQTCQQLAAALCKLHCPHISLLQHRQGEPSDGMKTAQKLARALCADLGAQDSPSPSSGSSGDSSTSNGAEGTASKERRGGEGGGYKPS
jgi:hypothetical protein